MAKRGRPKGSKNKSKQAVQEIVQNAVDFGGLVIALAEKALGGDVAAAKLLFEYGYGRPHQTVDVNHGGGLTLTMEDIRKMPQDKLERMLAGELPEVVLADAKN